VAERLDLEHRRLRAAIEFAVVMAEEAAKRRTDLGAPAALRKHFGSARIPSSALGGLRRAIEGAPAFRAAIAQGAVPELVDPIGVLWLQRPDGWEQQIAALVEQERAEQDDADVRAALKREQKRRRAAEQAAARVQVDLADQQATIDRLRREIDDLRADLVKAHDESAELRAELIDVRNEVRHARDREAAAVARLDAVAGSPAGTPPTENRADDDVADVPGVEPAAVADVAAAVRELAGRLEALLPDDGAERAPRPEGRRPLRLPGGVIASSAEAAEALLRSDAVVLLDGYNVAKLAWPSRSLEEQRTLLLDRVENLARRFGADITVVFDGAAVVGAHAPRRRQVRVVYSPDGVLADDVIRDEVRRLPASRAVVVVTNDAEIVADVKAQGANVVPSNALLALL
jgi:predicted RNA-binding protein with PIN domain